MAGIKFGTGHDSHIQTGYFPGAKSYRPFERYLLKDIPGGGNLTALAANFADIMAKQRVVNEKKANASNYLLARIPGPGGKPFSGEYAAGGSASEKPGFISQLIDWASVPLHTTWNVAENFIDTPPNQYFFSELGKDVPAALKDVAAGAGAFVTRAPEDSAVATALFPFQPLLEGVANKAMGADWGSEEFEEFIDKSAPRTRGADIMRKHMGVQNPWAAEALGFVTDVALDPLTYVPVAGWAKKVKSIRDIPIRAAEAATAAKPNVIHTPEEIIRRRAAGEYDVPTAGAMEPTNPLFDFAQQLDPRAQQFGNQAVQQAVRRSISQPRPVAEQAITGTAPLTQARQFGNYFPANLQRTENIFPQPPPKPVRIGSEGLPGAGPTAPRIPFEEFREFGKTPAFYKMRPPRPAQQVARQVDSMQLGAQIKKGEALNTKLGTFSQGNVVALFKEILEGNMSRKVVPFPTAVAEHADEANKVAQGISSKYLKKTKTPLDNNLQANMWNRIWDKTKDLALSSGRYKEKGLNSKGAFQWRLKTAQSMLRSAEDALIAAGHTPQHASNIGMRLSDVLADMPNPNNLDELNEIITAYGIPNAKMIPHEGVRHAVNRALARRQAISVDYVTNLSTEAAKAKNLIDQRSFDPIERRKMLDSVRDAAEKSARDSGATVQEAKAFRELVEKNADLPRTTPDNRIYTPEHNRKVAYGKVDTDTIKKVDDEVSRRFGTPWSKMKAFATGESRGVVLTIMERMASWYGKGGMDRYALDAYQHGEAVALSRAMTANSLLKRFSQDELTAGFRSLQHGLPAANERIAEASLELEKWIKELVGSKTLKDTRTALYKGGKGGESGVAQRMNALMKDVNRELEHMGYKSVRKFRFKNTKWTDKETGRVYDFTPEGDGWWNSWKSWDINDDVPTYLYNLDLALERVGKRYAFMEDAAARFSRRLKSDEWTHQFDKSKYPMLEGRYFREIEYKQLKKTLDDMEKGPWSSNKKWVNHYATGLRVWKSGVTIYAPSHHIRNMIGDLFFTWTAGINDPRLFTKAAKVMNASKRYKAAIKEGDFDTLRELSDPANFRYEANANDIIVNIKGHKLTANDIYIGAHSRGILRDVNSIEELAIDSLPGVEGVNRKLARISPLRGKGRETATKVSQGREHYVRLHHFLGRIEQGLRKGETDMKRLMDEAAHDVRKWHPDGSELTRMEQSLRLIFPFYSWTRKAMPLVVQSAVTAPAKVLAYPRIQYGVQSAMGIQQDEEGMLDPYPDNQLFPDWIRSSGIGPIGLSSGNPMQQWLNPVTNQETDEFGREIGYNIMNPGNPFQDLVSQFTGTGEYNAPLMGGLEMLTPALKIPLEVAKGERFTGVPIDYDPAGYAFEQVPIASYFSSIASATPKKKEKYGRFNEQRLFNLLTAAGAMGTGPYIKSAQFDARERVRGY